MFNAKKLVANMLRSSAVELIQGVQRTKEEAGEFINLKGAEMIEVPLGEVPQALGGVMQQALAMTGDYTGRLDGWLGEKSEEAIELRRELRKTTAQTVSDAAAKVVTAADLMALANDVDKADEEEAVSLAEPVSDEDDAPDSDKSEEI